MNIQRLIILGILKQGPKHGYEIKKTVQKTLGMFTSLENKSIYYPLAKMEKEGLIKKKIGSSRGRPTRYVYTTTPRGDKEFLSLAMKVLVSRKRPFIDIDIPLYFLPYLESREVIARLRLRKRFLDKVKKWLTDNLKGDKKFSVYQLLLLRHHLDLLAAEEKFVGEIIKVVNRDRKQQSGGESSDKKSAYCR